MAYATEGISFVSKKKYIYIHFNNHNRYYALKMFCVFLPPLKFIPYII